MCATQLKQVFQNLGREILSREDQDRILTGGFAEAWAALGTLTCGPAEGRERALGGRGKNKVKRGDEQHTKQK